MTGGCGGDNDCGDGLGGRPGSKAVLAWVLQAMAAVGSPVSTAAPKDDIWLGTAVLASASAEAAVRDDRAGAVSTFVGTTRGTFDGKVVVRLEYEAYEEMALKQLAALCHTVRAKHPDVLHMAVHHRLGVVAVGEASVVIAVSSAHRREAIGRLGGSAAAKVGWNPLCVDGRGECARTRVAADLFGGTAPAYPCSCPGYVLSLLPFL